MNIYEWSRQEKQQRPENRGFRGAAKYKLATATAMWNGEPTEMILEPLWIYDAWLIAFRPVGSAPERALIVAVAAMR